MLLEQILPLPTHYLMTNELSATADLQTPEASHNSLGAPWIVPIPEQ